MQDLIDWIKKTGLENIVWTTDLDKTVLDTWADPNKMAPAPGLEETCRILESRTAGFYVITGRDADYVDNVVFPHSHMRLSAEYHNMARYEPFGAAQDLGPRPQWDLVDPEMDALVAANAGLRLRKKPFMRSLHYSQVPETQRPAIKAMLSNSLSAILEKLKKTTGQEIELTDGGLIFDMGPKGAGQGRRAQRHHGPRAGRARPRQSGADLFRRQPGRYSGRSRGKSQGWRVRVCRRQPRGSGRG